MKRLFASAALLLGSGCAAQAQWTAPVVLSDKTKTSSDVAAATAANAANSESLAPGDSLFLPALKPAIPSGAPVVTTALALPFETAEPAVPSPKPKFLYGGRDDYRWQLGLAATWFRFKSNVFNASAVGIKTSVSYFTNNWFAVEGNITAAYAPEIFNKEHVKLLVYGGGPKVAWRQRQWEPWIHGIFGGAHEQPQIAGQSKSTYSIQAGGGADYRWKPHLAFRLEGDYVLTGFFKQKHNDFQIAGGVVFHF